MKHARRCHLYGVFARAKLTVRPVGELRGSPFLSTWTKRVAGVRSKATQTAGGGEAVAALAGPCAHEWIVGRLRPSRGGWGLLQGRD